MPHPSWRAGVVAGIVGVALILIAAWISTDLIDDDQDLGTWKEYAYIAAQWIGEGAGLLLAAGLFVICWSALGSHR